MIREPNDFWKLETKSMKLNRIIHWNVEKKNCDNIKTKTVTFHLWPNQSEDARENRIFTNIYLIFKVSLNLNSNKLSNDEVKKAIKKKIIKFHLTLRWNFLTEFKYKFLCFMNEVWNKKYIPKQLEWWCINALWEQKCIPEDPQAYTQLVPLWWK